MKRLGTRLIWLSLLLSIQYSFAQGEANVEGIVVDADTDAPIPDAVVRVVGKAEKSSTDANGKFSFTLPEGAYKIRGTAPFYSPQVIPEILVAREQPTHELRIALAPQVVHLNPIKLPVRLSQSTERGLLEKRLQSSRIEDSISTEEISRLPASDAGEAIKRVTGISIVGGRYVFVRGLGERYSNTLLNNVEIPSPEPNRRVVPMDIFPASLLSSLQTVKTFSPDQPGGFAGGSVQVFTKDFPEALTMSVSMSTSMNTQTTGEEALTYAGGGLDFLGFDDGGRDLPELIVEKAGDIPIRERGRFTVSGFTPEEIQTFGRSFNNVWTPERNTAPVNQSYKFSVGNSTELFGKEFGYLGVLSYGNKHSHRTEERNAFRIGLNDELSPVVTYQAEKSSHEVNWGSVLNASMRFSPTQKVSLQTLFTHIGDDETRIWEGFNDDRNTDMRSGRLRYVERQLFSSQLGGQHDFDLGEVDLESDDKPDISMDWRLTYARAARGEPDNREMIYEDRGDGTFVFRDVTHSGSRFFFDLVDDQYSGRVDWKVPFRAEGLFKFGALWRDRNRTFDARRFRFLPSDNIDRFVDLSNPAEQLFKLENIAPRRFELTESTRANDNYLASDRVVANYVMVDLPVSSRWRLATGLRLEVSDQNVTTFNPFFANAPPILADLETLDLLPSVNLTYRLTERMNVRFAGSRTITRPDLRELAPFEFTDFVGGRTEFGNPDLERTQIQNYDFRWEVFPELGGVIAISAFYKRFHKPIEQIVEPQAEVRITYDNALGANNYGLEMELRQNLSVLYSGLRDFSINTNVAFISSRVELPDVGIQTSSERALQGQSPYIVNATLGYNSSDLGISSTIAYHVFGRRIAEVGNHGIPDVFEQPRSQLDATISRVIADYYRLSLSAKNLLDPDVIFKQGDKTYVRYRTGRSFSFGVSYSL